MHLPLLSVAVRGVYMDNLIQNHIHHIVESWPWRAERCTCRLHLSATRPGAPVRPVSHYLVSPETCSPLYMYRRLDKVILNYIRLYILCSRRQTCICSKYLYRIVVNVRKRKRYEKSPYTHRKNPKLTCHDKHANNMGLYQLGNSLYNLLIKIPENEFEHLLPME